MQRLAATASFAALMLAASLAHAAATLVLTDGQVIKGTEIVRKGESYLVTMDGGNTVSFPAALVKEVKLESDPGPETPPGFDFSGPKTLAGPKELPSQDARDQLKALGPSAKWTKDIIDPTWVPTSAYDPEKDVLAGSRTRWSANAIDTTWTPTAAYDMKKDVFAGTRASWARNVIDTTWAPKNSFGFKPLWPSAGPPQVLPPPKDPTEPPAPPPLASLATPWTCAEALFAKDGVPTSMTVRTVNGKISGSLGLPLYEAQGRLKGATRKAVFTIDSGECRMIGGDADALTGLNLPPEHATAQDVASLNAVLRSRGGPLVPVGVNNFEYAFAVVSITDPSVSGSTEATFRMLERPDELRTIASKAPLSCNAGKSQRRKEERAATTAFAPPKNEANPEGDVVTFLTWSSAGGVVARNRVVLGRDGATTTRTVIASHVGAHKD